MAGMETWPAALQFLAPGEASEVQTGKLSLYCKSLLRFNKKKLELPKREYMDASCTLASQSAPPEMEELTVRIFFGVDCLEVTFKRMEDAAAFFDAAAERYSKENKSQAPHKAAQAAPAPEKAATPTPVRRKREFDDDGFLSTAAHGRFETHSVMPQEKRARTNAVMRPLQRAPPPRSSALQRRPSNPPQDSSMYRGYRDRSSLALGSFGLQNLGNTCYLNAVTQAISALREFVTDLRDMPRRICAGKLFKCTVDILDKMQDTSLLAPLSPAKLREQIAVAAPMFRGSGQQDAHEFFLEYMNQLHDELLSGLKATEPMEGEEPLLATQSHFDAEVQKNLRCIECGHSRQVLERFRDFSLDFGGDAPEQLQEMLRRYFQPEILEAKCEHCSAETANVDLSLTEFPKVMVLHLKRFVPNMEKQIYEKQHQAVRIPSTLDLGLACASPRPPARPLAAESPSRVSPGSPAGPSYRLRAVVAHDGPSPRAGHYVCYSCSATGEWSLYDDSRVKRLPVGEEPWSEVGIKAYMLFYVLCKDESDLAS
ncbi:unnamed protein product [Effrenium voratum]|nr:unnamed protein product [Effrenium voratum]